MNRHSHGSILSIPPSLTAQLIAYIGNKRRLLPFLAPIFSEVADEVRAHRSGPTQFLDPMSGSGAVSRLARHLGFVVAANDWEHFAHVVSAAYLENSEEELDTLFGNAGGMDAVLGELNARGRRAAAGDQVTGELKPYIARHFAPQRTASPVLGRERLFYTAENARFIDAVRWSIDDLFPDDGGSEYGRARRLLIALLLYEAATHVNTSGVFKAYHRGYGGHGRDALRRILSPMELEYPCLPHGTRGGAESLNAADFVAGRTADICYLDPPYNSHQYGSNYFMLNTIARWDRPPVDDTLDESGTLVHKAGIRSDWKTTRSPFCYRANAARALEELVDRIDASAIVVSYAETGVVPAEQLADLLASRGELRLYGAEYPSYRGGRQSITRAKSARELVFVVLTSGRVWGRPVRLDAADERRRVERQLLEWRVAGLLRGRFVPLRLRGQFQAEESAIRLTPTLTLQTADYHAVSIPDDASTFSDELSALTDEELAGIEYRLRYAICEDHEEEFSVLVALMRTQESARKNRSYQRRMLTCLRKYAHRKYREKFRHSTAALRQLIGDYPDHLSGIREGFDRVVAQAQRRFGE